MQGNGPGGRWEQETGQDWREMGERPAKRWLGKSWEWIGSPRIAWMERNGELLTGH